MPVSERLWRRLAGVHSLLERVGHVAGRVCTLAGFLLPGCGSVSYPSFAIVASASLTSRYIARLLADGISVKPNLL